MRKRKKQGPMDYIELPSMDMSAETKRGILIIFILILAALCLLGLFDLAGAFGKFLAKGEMLAFGWGKWLFPVILFAWGFFLYKEEKAYFRGASILGIFLGMISIEALFTFFIPQAEWRSAVDLGHGGGFLGLFLASTFIKIIGFWGGLIVLLALLVIAVLLVFNTSLSKVAGGESFFAKIFNPFKVLFGVLFGKKEEEEADDSAFTEASADKEEPSFTKKSIAEEAGDNEIIKKEEVEEAEEDLPVFAKTKEKKAEAWKSSKVKIDLPFTLLDSNSSKASAGDTKSSALLIQRTLENFGIPVGMGETKVGPTVTQYSFKPADGVKLSRITTLSNDLALALAAHPIRIEAPIPGQALVGIEVPNKTKAIVGLKEVLETKEFQARKNNLTIALGRDVSGAAWFYDITRMPHLLVAGATNSGKSVCLNTIIVSLLFQNNPEDLRFIMVDPKRVELTVYDGIPHLLTPVITNVQKTINALRWCMNEMDRRFDVLQNFKKRNIQSYNAVAKEKMPYIVFVVDELADLMVAAGRDIEGSVIRLTQMARAVGIHLILATQRPSVDVITGLIKANIPARIAFSVASAVDSKTILDGMGAEKLLGKGDMLFTTPEISKPKRIQGAYVSDNEIKRIVDYIKEKSGNFEYVTGVTEMQKVKGLAGVGLDGSADEPADELLEAAKKEIIESGKASATFLQRKLSVGYARAAKILDILEEMGIVGPSNGAKGREVLISKEDYYSMQSAPTSGASLHNRAEAEKPEEYLGNNSLGEAPEDDDTVFIGEEDEEDSDGEKENIVEKDETEVIETVVEDNDNDGEEEAILSPEDENNDENSSAEVSKEEGSEEAENPKKKPFNPDEMDKFFSR